MPGMDLRRTRPTPRHGRLGLAAPGEPVPATGIHGELTDPEDGLRVDVVVEVRLTFRGVQGGKTPTCRAS